MQIFVSATADRFALRFSFRVRNYSVGRRRRRRCSWRSGRTSCLLTELRETQDTKQAPISTLVCLALTSRYTYGNSCFQALPMYTSTILPCVAWYFYEQSTFSLVTHSLHHWIPQSFWQLCQFTNEDKQIYITILGWKIGDSRRVWDFKIIRNLLLCAHFTLRKVQSFRTALQQNRIKILVSYLKLK